MQDIMQYDIILCEGNNFPQKKCARTKTNKNIQNIGK